MFTCYTNELKHTCQKVVVGVSLVLGIAGLATIAVGVMATGNLPPQVTRAMDEAKIKIDIGEELATPIIAFGVILLLVSFLGCSTAKFKNPCLAIPFGAINLIFGLALIIVAGYTLGGEEAQQVAFNLACPAAAQDRTKLNPFDKAYNRNVDRIMCSSVCPCKRLDGINTNYPWSLSDTVLRTFGRTKVPTIDENTAYNNGGRKAAIIPLNSVQGKDADYYNTFQECYLKVLDKDTFKGKNKEFADWVKNSGFDTVSYFEKDLKCAGLCTKPLLFSTQKYTIQPKDICLNAITKKFEGPIKTAGYVSIVTAIIAFLGFCGSFPLCTKFNDDEGEDK